MSVITLGGNPVNTIGQLPEIGTQAKDFKLVATDLSTKSLSDFTGSDLIFNIFPSVDTGICSSSVRTFNEEASSLKNTKVICISRDLPFRQDQFCAAEGLDNVIMLSDFKTGEFGKTYGILMTDGGFDGLLSRCVIVVNKHGKIIYTEQVAEIGNEPNYQAALDTLSDK